MRLLVLLIVIILSSCTSEKPKIRILTAGIAHESNSFNPARTTEKDFIIRRDTVALVNEAWANYLKSEGVEIIPTLHVESGPSGTVAQSTYESFRDEILNAVKQAGKIDGVYLEMHGALHADGYEDAQVDLLQSIRKITGEDVLIAGSFDLHGNISKEFASGLNILAVYRTAPHIDQVETKLRAVTLLLQAIRNQWHPVIAHLNIPIIIPGEKGITANEPLKTFYNILPTIGKEEGLMDGSIFVGMPWTDVARAGMSIQVVARDKSYLSKAEEKVKELAGNIWELREELKFDVAVSELDDAINTAVSSGSTTVFITDSGDNTTAGAAGDNPLVLSALLAHHVKDAVVAGIVDPEAVKACQRVGAGKAIELTIGGKMDTIFGKPYKIKGVVRKLINTDSTSVYFGDQAIVDLQGVQLILISNLRSYTSPGEFKKVGIDPLGHKIVVVKLGYLFQGLRDISPQTIMALTPGFAFQDIVKLPYKNIRRPIFPLDPEMTWEE